jgi:large subunit ribosomal protein L28
MSKCEVTGKGPVVKNLVSHSNIKTKSTALPNVQKKRIFSRVLNQMVRLQIATSAIRDMEHMGGFDNFILNQDDSVLSKRALTVKSKIKKKIGSSKKN